MRLHTLAELHHWTPLANAKSSLAFVHEDRDESFQLLLNLCVRGLEVQRLTQEP